MWFNKYMNVPFLEKGRTMEGADCWGLVCLVYKNELGIDLKSYDDSYKDTLDVMTVNQTINNERENWQDTDKPKEFDVIILNMRGLPMHVGIVTGKGKMIHCQRFLNTCHERYDTMRWSNRVVGFSRWNN